MNIPVITDKQVSDLAETVQDTFDEFIHYDDFESSPGWVNSSEFCFADHEENTDYIDDLRGTEERPFHALHTTRSASIVHSTSASKINAQSRLEYSKSMTAHHLARLNHRRRMKDPAQAERADIIQSCSDDCHTSALFSLKGHPHSDPAGNINTLSIQQRRRLSRSNQGTINRATRSPVISDSVRSSKRPLLPSSLRPAIEKYIGHTAGIEKESQSIDLYRDLLKTFASRAYSATGYDLLGALMKYATRPNPIIDIGPVDLSCSFTISAAEHPDQPIIYCSDKFCQLTGYERNEIIGRNCRFLQSPDGSVQKGSERLHTDNQAVRLIKAHIAQMEECQTSLINYRRDGTPFINLLTIVPFIQINRQQSVFFVGFQVDLVEQIGMVTGRTSQGFYALNHSLTAPMSIERVLKRKAPYPGPSSTVMARNQIPGKKVIAQELAKITHGLPESPTAWASIILENHHDIVYVLSIKGVFLYISPSIKAILGYRADELEGRSIGDFCHPADLVQVMRELKECTSNASIKASARRWAHFDGTVNPPTKGGVGQTGPAVNLMMRMKRKDGDHEWIESVGKLHLEQGKGRKVVISTARIRPVLNLPYGLTHKIFCHPKSGFWFKCSLNGLILSTSDDANGNSRQTSSFSRPTCGDHLKDLIKDKDLNPILQAISSSRVSVISHHMSSGVGEPLRPVESTIFPLP
ncbi:hypothetical protein L7F22_044262 [Adiantum nelumboides]|nr:hypothetical protein [Adiantum nelumboides]